MDDRERRLAKNEEFWRSVNELQPPDSDALNAIFCECGNLDCERRLQVTAAEYHQARETDTTFIVAPGHELPEIERVVETTDRYSLVEKLGEAGEEAST